MAVDEVKYYQFIIKFLKQKTEKGFMLICLA